MTAMDFLTALAYIGMFVLVVLNAVLVARMKIEVRDEDEG